MKLKRSLYWLQVIPSISTLTLIFVTNSKSWSANEKDDLAWDDPFISYEKNVGDHLNSEGPEEAMPDIESSTYIDTVMHGDETENVEILGTPEASLENVPLAVAPGKCLLPRFLL